MFGLVQLPCPGTPGWRIGYPDPSDAAHPLARCRQEVAQKALQQELQQGAQKGRLEGEALALQRLLIRRFGALPEWVQARLRTANAE
jgi:hypothetical protein